MKRYIVVCLGIESEYSKLSSARYAKEYNLVYDKNTEIFKETITRVRIK